MGNCILKPSKAPTAKLVDAQGYLRRIEVPVTVAELMFDEPGYIVSLVEELRRTLRISAMRADQELQAGKLYLLFPMKRASCKVSKEEMALIDACFRKKGVRHNSKVFPAILEFKEEKIGKEKEVLQESDTGFLGPRLGNYRRQWRPILEPIYERN